jgi:hypothetical protein
MRSGRRRSEVLTTIEAMVAPVEARPAAPSAHDPREDLEEPFVPEDRHRRTHRYRSFPAVNRRVMPGGRLVGPSPGLPVTHSVSRSEGLCASVRRHRSDVDRPEVASVDPTEARYGRTLNKKRTTANQWVGALLTGRGDWTAIELFVAGVRGWRSWRWRQLENSQLT